MNPISAHALTEGIALFVVHAGFSVIGVAGCWMGLKVSQVCKQKEGSFPQDSWKKTSSYLSGRIPGRCKTNIVFWYQK